MVNNGKELASEMGVDLNHLQKAWGKFQTKKEKYSPAFNIGSTKMLLNPNEQDYLIYLGLEYITENIQNIIEKGVNNENTDRN